MDEFLLFLFVESCPPCAFSFANVKMIYDWYKTTEKNHHALGKQHHIHYTYICKLEFWLGRDKIMMLGQARVYTRSCTCIGHCLGLAFFLLNGVLSSFFIFWLVIFILESYQEKKRGNKATEIYGGGTNNYNTIQSIVLNFRANLTLTFLFLNSSAHGLRLIFCANQYTYGRIWKV